MKHAHGTRFEFVLESSEGAARAVYRATVERVPEPAHTVAVEITPAGAAIVGDAAGLPAELAHQLVALAKTIGRRADDAPWPRRIHRWRQPGVR